MSDKIMSDKKYLDNPLWNILVDTVHAMIMYPHHKGYVRDIILLERPEIMPEDLALNLGIPLGEAIVILDELKSETHSSFSSETTIKATETSGEDK
jgi:hypothetical protein